MTSLAARVVILCVLVAVLATAIAAVSAGRAAGQALDRHEEHGAQLAIGAWQGQCDDALDAIDFETRDYATWDDLHQRMPLPDPTWAGVNLVAGGHTGSLVSSTAIIDLEGRLRGRYFQGHPSGISACPEDPADPQALLTLGKPGTPARGFAVLGGHPALYARRPILTSDGKGPTAGTLVSLAYLDRPAVLRHLSLPGWTTTWTADVPDEPLIQRRERLRLTLALPTIDGPLAACLESPRTEMERIRTQTVLAVYGTGAVAALLAGGLGIILALHWLRPLRQLARECASPGTALSDGGDLDETRALATALRSLLAAERASRNDLAATLDRSRHLAAVHRAFLLGLSQEIGLPVARLGMLLRDGALTPERLAEAQGVVELLEQRLGDAAAVAGQSTTGPTPTPMVDLAPWLEEVATLLQPEARRQGITLEVQADGRAAVPRAQVTPVLIDLLANALRATPPQGHVHLTGTIEDQAIILTIADAGPGFPPELAERVRAAFTRGEVLAGEPGFGLGLALAIERIQRLGGHLHLTSNGPHGAVITVNLPRTTTVRRQAPA